MMNLLRPSRFLALLGVLALLGLPACGGGGGSKAGGGATGGTANPFSLTDLSGDWMGHLTPKDNSGLPWSNGQKRILSRNFYVRADGAGNFYFCEPGTEEVYDVQAGTAGVKQSAIGKKGSFSVVFKKSSGNREELVLIGRLNQARNLIKGEYELRSRTQNTVGSEVEAVDAGNFELVLSSGPGHFQISDLAGSWSGRNYHYAPRYTNMELGIAPNGDVVGGGIDDGNKVRKFVSGGVNAAAFNSFADSSVGRVDEVDLKLDTGATIDLVFVLLDDSGTYLTGVMKDPNDNYYYFRLVRQ